MEKDQVTDVSEEVDPAANESDPALAVSDSTLYSKFRGGDTSSYDQLVIRYGDSLTVFLYGYLHDWDDAEDEMIEAFARIMARRPSIKEGSFKAYLFRTARNLALRLKERKAKFQVFSLDGIDPEVADGIVASGTGVNVDKSPIEDELQSAGRDEVLRMCMDRLDPELNEALWLIYFEDMTYEQAASIMGVNEKRISRLLTRGKQQMRKELTKEGITSAY